MKIRTTKYILEDGLINTYRNKLMSIASISIVFFSLLIFGTFLIFTLNASHKTTEILTVQSEIRIFCDPKLDETQVKRVEEDIKKNENVKEYRVVDKKQALEELKTMLGEKKKVLEGWDEGFLPVAFVVKLKNPVADPKIIDQLKGISGVEDVTYPKGTVELLAKIADWVRVISMLLIAILLIISTAIIANTIKLTVFARRREISIMKYIGATDWFIRWPFIVEGIVIGFIGALLSFLITYMSYGTFERWFSDGMLDISFNLIKMNDIAPQLFAAYSIIGMMVGGIGSAISIRKYLHV